jgi:hypothetical protein
MSKSPDSDVRSSTGRSTGLPSVDRKLAKSSSLAPLAW